MGHLQTEFLLPGARPAADVARELADFVAAARDRIDVAIYDFQAADGAPTAVAAALQAARDRGVRVRVAFNVERKVHPAAPRPPKSSADEIAALGLPSRGVRSEEGGLMHHKYAVRDGEAVWTGSMNWTEDAFALEENAVLRLTDPEVAAAYGHDFEQLWTTGVVERSGGAGAGVRLDGALVRPYFSPRGPSLAQLVASTLATARHRVRILSPVVTAGAVLGTLAELAGRHRFDVSGAYDLTQMEQVQAQWREVPANHWKIEAWKVIAPRLSGKRSTPYAEGSVHDYMHAKVVVADDEVVAGSYNLSRGGEDNAENVVHIVSGDRAHEFAQFAEAVAARYATTGTARP